MRICACCYNATIDKDKNRFVCAIDIPDDYVERFRIHKDHPNDSEPWINGALLERWFGLKWIDHAWYTPKGQKINRIYKAQPFRKN